MKARKVWVNDPMCFKACIDRPSDRACAAVGCISGRWLAESDYRKIMAVIKAAKDEYNRGLGTHKLMEAVDKMEK